MQRVLIIAESYQQQERLRIALQLDRSIQLVTATARQINSKNLRLLRQSDLVILEESVNQAEQEVTEYLLGSLKKTGLPIILLPPADLSSGNEREPLVLNLTEEKVAQPGLAALINQIRLQYMLKARQATDQVAEPGHRFLYDDKNTLPTHGKARSSEPEVPSIATFLPQQPTNQSSKITYALTAIDRISKELREPLSNMNLAIHMLGRVHSLEERDRYLKLLREEYKRELQLVTELENLQASLAAIL